MAILKMMWMARVKEQSKKLDIKGGENNNYFVVSFDLKRYRIKEFNIIYCKGNWSILSIYKTKTGSIIHVVYKATNEYNRVEIVIKPDITPPIDLLGDFIATHGEQIDEFIFEDKVDRGVALIFLLDFVQYINRITGGLFGNSFFTLVQLVKKEYERHKAGLPSQVPESLLCS